MCTYINCWTTASVFMNMGLNYCLFIKVLKFKTINFFLHFFPLPLVKQKASSPVVPNTSWQRQLLFQEGMETPLLLLLLQVMTRAQVLYQPGIINTSAYFQNIQSVWSVGLLLSHFRFIVAGGSGLPKVPPTKTEVSSNISISHTVVDSDGSDR